MKKFLAACIVVLAAAPMAHADDASKAAKVHELFQAMHMERMMGQITDQMTGYMKQQFQATLQSTPGGDQMTPEQKKISDDFFARVMKLAFDTMSWKAMEPEYTRIYIDNYTEEQIDAITAFYKSPAGQVMLEKTPQITAATLKIVQSKMVDLQPKMKELTDEYMQQMKDYRTPK